MKGTEEIQLKLAGKINIKILFHFFPGMLLKNNAILEEGKI